MVLHINCEMFSSDSFDFVLVIIISYSRHCHLTVVTQAVLVLSIVTVAGVLHLLLLLLLLYSPLLFSVFLLFFFLVGCIIVIYCCCKALPTAIIFIFHSFGSLSVSEVLRNISCSCTEDKQLQKIRE